VPTKKRTLDQTDGADEKADDGLAGLAEITITVPPANKDE